MSENDLLNGKYRIICLVRTATDAGEVGWRRAGASFSALWHGIAFTQSGDCIDTQPKLAVRKSGQQLLIDDKRMTMLLMGLRNAIIAYLPPLPAPVVGQQAQIALCERQIAEELGTLGTMLGTLCPIAYV